MEKFLPFIYDNEYQIGDMGTITSTKRGIFTKLKPKIGTHGYKEVSLLIKGRRGTRSVHRLVAITFLGESKKLQVNHIDGDKLNNKLENLEYVTVSDNHKHRYRILGHKPPMLGRTGKLNPKSKKINQYDIFGKFIKTWDSMSDIQRITGINTGAIHYCCNSKTKIYGGFKWEYA